MNRREFLKLMLGAAGYFSLGNLCSPKTAEAVDLSKGYHIVLISDLHLPWRSTKFPKASKGKAIFAQKEKLLKNINSWKDAKEVALLGDFPARYGNEQEFLSVDKFLNEISHPKYLVIGNHDVAYRDKPSQKGKLKRGTHEEQLKKLNAFKERYNMPDFYYARTIGKHRLLYLAPDACGKINIELTSAQLEWMKQEVLNHQNGPIIFFCHAPLTGTLLKYFKSINTPSATAQPEKEIDEILKYAPPGSLWVSGHTHTPATNESFADDKVNRYNENVVNIHNPTLDGSGSWTNSLYLFDDRTVVRTYDHKKNIWLEQFTREYKF